MDSKIHNNIYYINGHKIFQIIWGTNMKSYKLKGIVINTYSEMMMTSTLCRDCNHTIIQYI